MEKDWDGRPDPELLLRQNFPEKPDEGKGKLKIFFGYAAGVGKTYAMLDAAHQEMAGGRDVAAGYIEPHDRPDTLALLDGMELLTPKCIEYKGITLREFDLDAALIRKPNLILVDELAHTNASGCRHKKRYQDVMELLDAGINVYTTVNVQHLESLHDIVASITHVRVKERIPDSVFDNASQVELVDIEPEALRRRLEEGKIYPKNQVYKAGVSFFTAENLSALREIALRRTADRVNREVIRERDAAGKDYFTGEHVLVCLSPSPTNAKVIRTAARMAGAFHADFTAILVETEQLKKECSRISRSMEANISLAKEFRANVITLYGDDIVEQVASYARQNGISKIVIGRTVKKRYSLNIRPAIIDRLIKAVPNMDVYVIPDASALGRSQNTGRGRKHRIGGDLLTTTGIMALCTLVFMALDYCRLGVINVAMLVCALVTSSMAARLKTEAARGEAESRYMQILFSINRNLRKGSSGEEILDICGVLVRNLLKRNIAVYDTRDGRADKIKIYPALENEDSCRLTALFRQPDEMAVAAWVYKNRHKAGAATDTLPGAGAQYMPVYKDERVYAVIGVELAGGDIIAPNDKNVLNIIAEETSYRLGDMKNQDRFA